MRLILSLFLSIFSFNTFLFAQTEISGVINQYQSVLEIDYCLSKISVNDATPFEVGNAVLLIQMKGAIVAESNNASFGSINDIASAGKYERAIIDSISGNDIYLKHQLTNEYAVTAQLQLITIPSYTSAIVVDTLKAKHWDGNTGGVLIFDVFVNLSLNAPIDVSAAGFRGGKAVSAEENNCEWFLNPSAYFYNSGNWRGADKGEGIANFVIDKEAGRGAWSNGGGGGNDHNSGGGGGANISNGGDGGENEEPQLFGCDGVNPGLAGRAITDKEGRIFLGGGGGAGHMNNDAGTSGGNGGGLIIISAREIVGNQYSISANGESVAITPAQDGAGGGGGGGSIILDIVAINDAMIEARGGNGGDANNNNGDRCMGPGGGGSGGRILVNEMSLGTATVHVDGGVAGLSKNSAVCDESSNGAESGMAGLIEEFVAIPRGNVVITNPTITSQPNLSPLCISNAASIQVAVEGNDLSYQWQVDRGNGFEDLEEEGGFTGTQSPTLDIAMIMDEQDTWLFRCSIVDPCFGTVLSEEVQLNLIELPLANFDFTADEEMVMFTNNSVNADSYQWYFGDGVGTATVDNPIYDYDESGEYEVVLISINECGSDTTMQVVIVDIINSVNELEGVLFDVYPNPVEDYVHVILNRAASSTDDLFFSIQNIDGRQIYTQQYRIDQNFSQSIDMSMMPSGFYVLQIQLGKGLITKRIVKY